MSEESKLEEILNRLEKIEKTLMRIEKSTGFGINTLSNVTGDALWSLLEYNLGLFRDPDNPTSSTPDAFPFK